MATGADRQDSRDPKKENSASERAGFSDSVKRDQVGSRSDQNHDWHRPSTQIYTGVPHRVWKRQHACQIGRYTEANWELWRRHGSGTSTQVGQFYIQLSAINRSQMRTANKFWLVACWLLVSPCSLPARAEGNTRSTRSWHLQERVHRAQPVKFSPTHTTLYTTMSYYWTANRAYGDRQAK